MSVELLDLPKVETGDVYKAGVLAGHFRRRREGNEFAYHPEHLAAGGEPVATTLPLTDEPVFTPAGALPPFFSGLLPEGRRLTALRRAVKTSADDELSLLLAVGRDMVGDVQVVPHGEPAHEGEPFLNVDSWDRVRFRELLARGGGLDPEIDLIGVPGVQDKVSARMIALPVGHADARFILKLNPPEYPHLVENEAFFLQAAEASGLTATTAHVVRDGDGEPGLLVERFDRVPREPGGVRSLAQEDACQVLGRYPADKYAVSSEEVVEALTSATRARPPAGREVILQLAFAYLSCNGDAHAKNFSVVRSAHGEWRVSPLYDAPSSHPYGDTTLALTVNGRRREDVGRADFLALADRVGVRRRAVERSLDELCERATPWIDRLGELPFDDRRLHRLRRAVMYRRDRLTAPTA